MTILVRFSVNIPKHLNTLWFLTLFRSWNTNTIYMGDFFCIYILLWHRYVVRAQSNNNALTQNDMCNPVQDCIYYIFKFKFLWLIFTFPNFEHNKKIVWFLLRLKLLKIIKLSTTFQIWRFFFYHWGSIFGFCSLKLTLLCEIHFII